MDRAPGLRDARRAFCFFYDTRNFGIVGDTPSFGSKSSTTTIDYGYFLYAAGVLAADDPGSGGPTRPRDGPAGRGHRDLAGHRAALVARRNFDSYQSHSWASGTSLPTRTTRSRRPRR